MKNWTQTRKRERGREREDRGERRAGPSCKDTCSRFKYSKTSFWGGGTVPAVFTSAWKWWWQRSRRQIPVNTVPRWFLSHPSTREDIWTGGVASSAGWATEILVKKYPIQPPTHSRRKYICPSNLNKTNQNENYLLLHKEHYVETNAPRKSLCVCVYTSGRGYFVLDST